MISIKKSWILVLLTISFCQPNIAQNIDSLLLSRDNLLQEYTHYKDNIGERTWIKLVNLSKLANNLIEADNQLVKYYYKQEMGSNSSFKARAEDLKLEISLLNRENEIQKMVLSERKSLFNILLLIIGGISILLISMLIFAIDRHVRFRNTRMELERTWAGENITPEGRSSSEEEFMKVNTEIRSLSTENTKLKDQVLELMNKIKEKEEILDEELDSRKQLKAEIRNLITQIKSQ